MATLFSLTRDCNGFNGFGLQFSDTKYSSFIDQSTDTTLTIPGDAPMGIVSNVTVNKYLAIFSFEPASQVWVANNETAEIPVGNTFSVTGSELNPTARAVNAGDVLHFITSDSAGANVSVIIYALL